MKQPHLPFQVSLKKNEDRRLLQGHPWVFSNEIREVRGTPPMGGIVEVLNAAGITIGIGFYHPHSLIAVRLLSPIVEEIDEEFFRRRLREAIELRERLYPRGSALRLIHGESDFLPGLIVDRFNDQLAVQTLSYGMDCRLPMLVGLLEELLHPAAIIERNDSPLRTMEELPLKRTALTGAPTATIIVENGIQYEVNPLEGQKTGFFFDQRENRALVGRISAGLRVLDCFCNDGGFALNAARGGAASVTGIDSSGEAIAASRANAMRNGLAVTFEEDDVFAQLNARHAAGEVYDLIVLDPPSFTRNRKTVPAARQGYRDLHQRALRLLAPNGILATASCSHHILPDVFLADIHATVRKAGRSAQVLDWRGAAPDHPTLPGVPETGYLKFALLRIAGTPGNPRIPQGV